MIQTTQRGTSHIATKRWLQLLNPVNSHVRFKAFERIRFGQKNWWSGQKNWWSL